MENQMEYKTVKKWDDYKTVALIETIEIEDKDQLIAAMRDNIEAKETIWGSLIRDNMELGQAIQDIANAWYDHQGIDYDAGEALEEALDRALKLAKGVGK